MQQTSRAARDQALSVFHVKVEKLASVLRKPGVEHVSVAELLVPVIEPIEIWREWERETYLGAIEHVLRSETWSLLLQWLCDSVESLCSLRVPARVAEACFGAAPFPRSAAGENTAAGAPGQGGCASPPAAAQPGPSAPAAAADAHPVVLLQAHDEVLRLLSICLKPAKGLAQDHAAEVARNGGGGRGGGRGGRGGGAAARPGRPPAPLPRLLESMSRAARSVLMSHLLRRYARLAAQAADAAAYKAAAAVPADDACSGGGGAAGSGSGATAASSGANTNTTSATSTKTNSSTTSSSSRSEGAVAEESAACEGLNKMLTSLVLFMAEISEIGVVLLQLQQSIATFATPGSPPSAAAAAKGGGRKGKAAVGGAAGAGGGGGGGGGVASSAACIGGAGSAADRGRPLASLLVWEEARSGFLDQSARLVLHGAAAEGRARLQQQQQPAGMAAGSSSGSSSAVGGGSSTAATVPSHAAGAALTLRLSTMLCTFTQPVGRAWWLTADSASSGSSSGIDSSGSSSGSSSSSSGSSTSTLDPQPQQVLLPPMPWGTCLQMQVLSQVVATLAAAGFGGGERGVWGLPAELAAGLPVLGHPVEGLCPDLRFARHTGGLSSCVCDEPFTLLNHMMRWLSLKHMALLTGAAAEASASASGGTAAAAAAADTPAEQRGAGDWSFPLSPHATARVLLRVADLGAASIDLAAASVSFRGALPARGSRLRLRHGTGWDEGMDAVMQARQLLMRPRLQRRMQQAQQQEQQALPPSSGGAAGGGRAGGRGLGGGSSSSDTTRAGPTQSRTPPSVAQEQGGADADSGGGGDGGGFRIGSGDEFGDVYPRLPVAWWRGLAVMLPRAVVLPLVTCSSSYSTSSNSYGGASAGERGAGTLEAQADRVSTWAKILLTVDFMPPAELPPRPPPALAAALAGGLVPAVEAAIRAAPHHGLAVSLADALLQVPAEGLPQSGGGWPLFQQLLAFAPPAQTAALITSIGKRLHAALDRLDVAANTGAIGLDAAAVAAGTTVEDLGVCLKAALIWMRTVRMALPDRFWVRPVTDAAAAAAVNGDISANAVNGDIGAGGLAEQDAAAAPLSLQERRLRLLCSHTLHRWLPALSRCVRFVQPGGAFDPRSLAPHYEVLMQWCVQLLRIMGGLEAAAAVAASCGGPGGGPGGDDTAGNPQGAATAMAAEIAANAASWRQWLLHDVELLPLLETGLRLLAALPPPSSDPGAAGVAQKLTFVLALMPRVAPDALAPVLRLPLPPSSPWHPSTLADVLNRHNRAAASTAPLPVIRAVEMLRAAATRGATQAELRASYNGGPVARSAILPWARAEAPLLCEVSPLLVEGEAEAMAAEVAAAEAARQAAAAGASGSGGSGGSGGGGSGGAAKQPTPTPAVPPAWTLRCCGNPRCTNLAGPSESDLPLQACGGCKAVRYCGRACQAAHWRAGHKEACGVFKGRAFAVA